ncbi:tryptophan 7-halogenase [Altererythrobacter sp. MTPC7]|uniref:tryptophan 7-halogenase n=1 Tax=Altererythrobacter sp. MTPC7 TaxID=3056567 RepID=UPI0036F39CF9
MTAAPSQTVRSVLLAGLPRDVWPVAALLARELPECTAMTVVVDKTPVPPAGAVVPLASRYHERLGQDLAAFVRDCGSIPSLGSVLQGFAGVGHSLVVAPSGDLPAIAGASLHQFLPRAQADGGNGAGFLAAFAPFRFAARAAEAGKFALPGDGPNSPLAMLGPQVGFDRDRYALMLREGCAWRCEVKSGTVAGGVLGPDGHVKSVALEGGEAIEADFFVDCSGRIAALLDASPERIDSPASIFGKITCAVEPLRGDATLPTWTADAHGIAARIPTEDGDIVSYRHTGEVADEHFSNIAGPDAVTQDAPAAPVAAAWQGNCVRLGEAVGSLGSALCGDAALLAEMALHLAECLPARTAMAAEARAFNRRYRETLAALSDFASAPLLLNRRSEAPWQSLARGAPSATLGTRIEQFASRGHIPSFEREYADRQTWTEMLAGLGIRPKTYDRRVDTVPEQQAGQILLTIRRQLETSLAAMTSRDAYLAQLG